MNDDTIELSNNMADSNATFPLKLFAMMMFDNGNHVSWLEHGLAFRVLDVNAFAQTIIPKYFKQTKMTSFQRQLNLYGFRRLTKGEDQGAYFHPKFQRGRRDLLSEIKRLPGKGNSPAVDYSGFEDFISMRLSSTLGNQHVSYNLRTIESGKDSSHSSKFNSNSNFNANSSARSSLASSESKVTRVTRRTSPTSPSETANIYAKPRLNFSSTGVDENSFKNSRKRSSDSISSTNSSTGSSSFQKSTSTEKAMLAIGSHPFPASKSKLTRNIGFERLVHASKTNYPYIPQSQTILDSGIVPLSSFYQQSNYNYSQNHNSQNLSYPATSVSNIALTAFTNEDISNIFTVDEKDMNWQQNLSLGNGSGMSYEEYNRRRFDSAMEPITAAEFDQLDFDTIFSPQTD